MKSLESEKFRLYGSLVNIRPDIKADEDFWRTEDELLIEFTKTKGITDIAVQTARKFWKISLY